MFPPLPVCRAIAMVDALWAIIAHRPEIAERLTVFPRDLAYSIPTRVVKYGILIWRR